LVAPALHLGGDLLFPGDRRRLRVGGGIGRRLDELVVGQPVETELEIAVVDLRRLRRGHARQDHRAKA